MLPAYAELHCLSNFSFLRGASHPEELVERAAQAGYQALAITDECSLAGAVRAHLAARQAGLPLIVGSELQLARADGTPDLKLVLLPTNRNGYGDLAELITFGRRNAVKGCYRLTRADLDAGGLDDCLALLVPCRAASRVQAPQAMADLLADANWLAVRFASRAWLAVELHRDADDAAWLAALQGVACATGLPILASGDVHMHVRTRRRLQDVLTATRLRTTLDEAGRELFRNGERHLRSRAVQIGRAHV